MMPPRSRLTFAATALGRLIGMAIAVLALSAGFVPAGAPAQDVVVSGGAVQSNAASASYDSLEIFGTDGSGNPSTYDADAALHVAGLVEAHDSGVFNANADVTTDHLKANSGGVVNLNAGTLSADWYLWFEGTGSVNRSGGTYSTPYLVLGDNAHLSYGPGDSITVGAWVENGAVLELGHDLATSWYVILERGGSISRTGQTISTAAFAVRDATLDLIAGDSFDPWYWSEVTQGGTVNAAVGTTLGSLWIEGANGVGGRSTFNVNGDTTVVNEIDSYWGGVINLNAGTLSAGWIGLNGAGAMNQNGGSYSTWGLGVYSDASATYGTADAISNTAVIAGTLTLEKDLSLSGTLYKSGGASLIRNGHTYSANRLVLDDGAIETYGTGDSITTDVSIDRSTLVLDQDLSIAGSLYLGKGLVSPDPLPREASIVRNGHVVSTSELSLYNGQTFTYNAGDTITDVVELVGDGTTLSLDRDLALSKSLFIRGWGASIDRGSHAIAARTLGLADGADFVYCPGDAITGDVWIDHASMTLKRDLSLDGMLSIANAARFDSNGHTIAVDELSLWWGSASLDLGDTVARNVWVNPGAILSLQHDLTLTGIVNAWGGGSISLNGGTLTAGTLVLEEPGALRQNGGHYVTTALALYGGALASYGADDCIDSLTIDGPGSELHAFAPLTLSSLSISNGGLLLLHAFTGLGPSSAWALRLAGDKVSWLESLFAAKSVAGGRLVLSALYDAASGYTYVSGSPAAVPEIDPGSLPGVLALLGTGVGLLGRRRRGPAAAHPLHSAPASYSRP